MLLLPWIYSAFGLISMVLFTQAQSLQRFKRTLIGGYPICPRGCASCSAFNGCVTCKPKNYLLLLRDGLRQTGRCVAQCPRGYSGVAYGKYSRCYPCPDNCERCTRSKCTVCKDPFIRHRGKCIVKCPKHLHYASYTKQCLKSVPCVMGSWTLWGECTRNDQTCGYKYGDHSRTREILQNPMNSEVDQCPETIQTEKCRLKYRHCQDPNPTVPADVLQNYVNQKVSKRLRRRRRKRKHRNQLHSVLEGNKKINDKNKLALTLVDSTKEAVSHYSNEILSQIKTIPTRQPFSYKERR